MTEQEYMQVACLTQLRAVVHLVRDITPAREDWEAKGAAIDALQKWLAAATDRIDLSNGSKAIVGLAVRYEIEEARGP